MVCSERELRSRSLYVVACPSVVCNVRAPYSGGWNFRHFLRYLVPLQSIDIKKLRRSSQGNPSVGELNATGVAKYSDFGPMENYTSRKRCKIRGKLVLITNRKMYIWAFDWYQNRWPLMTLNGVMALILRYGTHCVKVYVFDVIVESSRSLSHLLMSWFTAKWPLFS